MKVSHLPKSVVQYSTTPRHEGPSHALTVTIHKHFARNLVFNQITFGDTVQLLSE